ncbi:Conserved hypothetical protein, putative polyhydroxyalkanoate granule-associated protein [Herminiimonas arsenicoxydans]|uniref:Poly granule associated protein n=1 Tax=Herminiimonas arsenicoxydans TaxID=204773 RepID=A4G4H1_HERAR|nr:Conserved hypothetical protein, putative polyhydroxyalkanoate granule-associated protein [Herminiimonas arsenicoxydans]
MAKKLKKSASEQLGNGVHASAQQIWQAGLDAFAKTQKKGGKVISKLAKDSSSLRQRTRKIAEDQVADVSEGLHKMSGRVSKQAAESWNSLEQLIEETVTRSLTSLGLSTQNELLALHKRIDALIKPGSKKTAVKKAAKKTPAKKAVAKNAAAKPAAKKKAVVKKTAAKTSK